MTTSEMTRIDWAKSQIIRTGLVAGMRGHFPPDVALRTAEALMRAGITAFELTMNSTQPIEAMQAIKREYGHEALVGMGTVLDVAAAQRVLDAGADCVIAPSFNPEVVALSHHYDVLAVPGVITPTEAVNAWLAGAKLIKIFPIGNLGVDYFKSIRGPLDHIDFMCNGGMTDENVGAFIKAGGVACGMAGWLTGDGTMSLDLIEQRARKLVDIVAQARAPHPNTQKA